MTQVTRSGGRHYFFRYPRDGKKYGNRAGFLPGLDQRGMGGYVIYYGIDPSQPIAEAPAWMLESSTKAAPETQGSMIRLHPMIAQGMVEASLQAIREAAPGESNNTLNVESYKLGQLVASDSITYEYASLALFRAAKDRGKADYEAKATIESGLAGGMKHPLISPFGESAPTVSIAIPPVPGAPERYKARQLSKYDLMNTSKLRKPQMFQDWSTLDIMITSGDGGTGKTTLKLFESICLALGERFLGFDCKVPGKTIYITGEDTEEKLGAIVGQIVRQMGLFEDAPGNTEKVQQVLNNVLVKKDADLCLIQKDRATGFLQLNSDALRKVMELIEDEKPTMIVWDPISSFWGSEAALNDMNKAVTKFMSAIVDRGVGVEITNHIGKTSSAQKDMSQFAGRGGTGLPSNSRVSRALRPVYEDEYMELTGETLTDKQSAMMCNVNKFTDGSPLYQKPFLILRDGYLFSRKTLTPQKAKEAEATLNDNERIFGFIKEERVKGKYPTRGHIEAYFNVAAQPISQARVKMGVNYLVSQGWMGESVKQVENPDLGIRERVYVITDETGKEF